MMTATPTQTRSFVRFSVLCASILLLSACNGSNTPNPVGGSEQSSSSVSFVPTPNVTYTGVVEELGPSIYMEGTHQLSLSTGGFILLSASDNSLDLDRYINAEVQVRGSVRPTVEGDAVHMQVTEVTVLGEEQESSSASASSAPSAVACGGIAGIQCPSGQVCVDDPTDSCDPQAGGADCSGVCVTGLKSSERSSSESSSVSSVSSEATQRSSSSETSSVPASNDMIVLMASQDYSESLWTQQYCTSHIAFCIPVHKNWYFKSFGATTNNLWHVEFSMEAIESLGEGPIVLNLVDATVEDAGASDGQIQTHGSEVIGFRSWTDGTHFESIADARLSAAVSFMLQNITPFTPEE